LAWSKHCSRSLDHKNKYGNSLTVPEAQPTSRVPRHESASGGVAAVDRALWVLAVLAEGDDAMSLSEIAHATSLYKSTILRLLASLGCAGLVARDPDGRYVVGPAIARLHATYMRSFPRADRIVAALHELATTTQESAAFYVRQGESRLCLHRIASTHAVRDSIEKGDLRPLGEGAAGRVLQAYAHIGDPALGRQIRREQVILLTGDYDAQLSEISAPVFGPLGEVLGAITLISPSERVQHVWVTPVRETARALSLQLGGQYPAPSEV
jgi:DNA-binding IclR family transcriptional regulator